MTPDIAQTYLQENVAPWVLALKPEVLVISAAETRLRMPITTDMCRTDGVVSAAALSALADVAMVLACGGHMGKLAIAAAATFETQYLRPTQGDALRAEAEVTRTGATTIFVDCALIAEPSNKAVALASATFSRAAFS